MAGRKAKLGASSALATFEVDFGTDENGNVLDKTLWEFYWDDSRVSCIQGPVGSAKTRTALMKLYRLASSQVLMGGKRKSRWVITKPTASQMLTSIIPDFLDLFPEGVYGTFKRSPPMTYTMEIADLQAEFIFIALDNPDDIKKLKSMNITGGYINEGQFTILDIVTTLLERSGRYPARVKERGREIVNSIPKMVLIDMNAADESHFIPIMRGDVSMPEWFTPDQIRQYTKPDAWRFFMQPPALLEKIDSDGLVVGYEPNPRAENLRNLPEGYYIEQIEGESKDVIDMKLMNRTGALRGGKPIFNGWNSEIHVARSALEYRPELKLLVGLDFGRTPAAVWGQQYGGRWYILGEYYLEDVSTELFIPALKKEMARRMPDLRWDNIQWWGDPAGSFKGQADEKTSFMIARNQGVNVHGQKSAIRFAPRKAAVDAVLARMVQGYPGILVDKNCVMLINGFKGGYKWRVVQGRNGETIVDEPADTKYTHVHDSLQYLLAGGGEITEILTGGVQRGNINTRVKTQVFTSHRAASPFRRR